MFSEFGIIPIILNLDNKKVECIFLRSKVYVCTLVQLC